MRLVTIDEENASRKLDLDGSSSNKLEPADVLNSTAVPAGESFTKLVTVTMKPKPLAEQLTGL